MSQNEEYKKMKGIGDHELLHGCAHAGPGTNILTSNLLKKPVGIGTSEGWAVRVTQRGWRELKEGVGTR